MAYTRNWDIASPAGSAQISGGDDAIRAMKEDIEERIESIFEDIDADPLEFKPSVIGAIGSKTGKTMIIPSTAFVAEEDEDDYTYFDQYMQSDNSGSRVLKAPLILPPGVIITEIEYLWNRDGALAGQRGELYGMDFDTGVALNAAISTTEETNAGIQLTSSGAMSHEVDPDRVYFIRLEPTSIISGGRLIIYGVRVTYDCGDATETL